MPLIKPFPGLRPPAEYASDVAAPPYDVMNEGEARAMVDGKPWSFLHISRPEVDLPEGTDPYASEVYAKAAENLAKMVDKGILIQDSDPCYYVYRLTMGEHVQTGLVAAASVEAYDRDRIKKHEFTRPKKEDDRVRQIDALDAQTGPVFLVYPSHQELDEILMQAAESEAELDVTAADGVRHQIWLISDDERTGRISELFEQMPALYVADGHHRSAAASRVTAQRMAENSGHNGEEPYNYFLTVVFPHNQMQILPYNRVVRDLNGLDLDTFLERVKIRFAVSPSNQPVMPEARTEFGMYLAGQWYKLHTDPERVPWDDPVSSLDVSILAGELIEPILGISDPRRDERIDFVGGIRGLEALERRVDSGEMAVAFSMYPTSMEALMSVADAGEVMPPKSTWFEPKLADGLVSHLIK
ncbi:MAG: DUF1015 family protein [Sedimenticola sp.]